MLFGFKAQNNLILDSFLKDFENPPGTVSRITSLWCYGAIHIFKLDDNVIIFKTNGILEFIGLRVMVTSIFSYCIGLVLGNNLITVLSFPFICLSLLFFLPSYHVRNTVNKLRRYGYKDKVKILDYLFVKSRFDYVQG